MRQLIIACSLSATSKSFGLADRLRRAAEEVGDEAELIDLRDVELPFCDAGACYEHKNVGMLREKIEWADTIALAVPIYNYETGGTTRNLIALTGKSWLGKVVGLMAAAGGERSYMALMPLASSLMLDFRCIVIPRFVYASKMSFDEAGEVNADVQGRIKGLARELHRVGSALKNAPAIAEG
jgi:FMN reductase